MPSRFLPLVLLPGLGASLLMNTPRGPEVPTGDRGAGAPDSLADVRAIRARRASSNAAIARHDTAGVAAILAPNVIVVSSNSLHIDGRQANAERFADQFRSRPDLVYVRSADSVQVFMPWRMAEERGRWTGAWTDTDGPIQVGGTYTAKWRERDGAWVVESETYFPTTCRGGRYCRTIP